MIGEARRVGVVFLDAQVGFVVQQRTIRTELTNIIARQDELEKEQNEQRVKLMTQNWDNSETFEAIDKRITILFEDSRNLFNDIYEKLEPIFNRVFPEFLS